MPIRHLLNLVLLCVVIGLATAVWYVQQHKNAPQYLTALDKSQINRIIIPRDKGDIVLTRSADNWMMASPYALPAHDFRVQTLLGLLHTSVSQAYARSELDLVQVELQPPRASIRFNEHAILFGNTNPMNNKRYVLSADKIYLLDDSLFPLLNAEAASLVNLSLLPAHTVITKLEMPGLSLQQASDHLWRDASNKTITADAAQQLLDNWRTASAYAVHAYLARNARPVTLTLDNGSVLHFMVARDNTTLIVGRPDVGVEYHFDENYANKLLKLPAIAQTPASKQTP